MGNGAAWAFLYSRNLEVDYSFALLPGFLIDKPGDQRNLAALLAGEEGERHSVRVEVTSRPYFAYYRIDVGKVGGEVARDDQGRRILAIAGLVCDRPLVENEIAPQLENVKEEISNAWVRFWRSGRCKPLIAQHRDVPVSERPPDKTPIQTKQVRVVLVGAVIMVGIVAWEWERWESMRHHNVQLEHKEHALKHPSHLRLRDVRAQ